MSDDVPAALAEALATVRAFQAASDADRVVLLIDQGQDQPATMIDGAPDGSIEVTEHGESTAIAARTPLGVPPRELPELRPAPPSAVAIDPDTGELEAPLGVIANYARGVLALATAFGGRSVAAVDFPTRDPEVPLTIAARKGENFVVAAGDRRFELPPEALR
jgi:hypothetical protein